MFLPLAYHSNPLSPDTSSTPPRYTRHTVRYRSQAILKILKHSTDPSAPQPQSSSSANYQGRDRENHHANDALGLLLGIDLSGTMEVGDCLRLPAGGDKLDCEWFRGAKKGKKNTPS